MKQWYQSIVAPYKTSDYATWLQARYLRLVCLLLLAALPALLSINRFVLNGTRLHVQIPIVVLWSIAVFSIELLRRKKLELAGQTILWTFLAGLWTIIFVDNNASALIRIDTVVFSFAILAIIPLMRLKHRYQLWLFHGLNLVAIVILYFHEQHRGILTEPEMRDYFTDMGIALIFFAVISNAIYTVNLLATKKIFHDMARLKETQLLLNQTIDAMPSIILSVDAEGVVTGWNQLATDTCGVEREAAIGKPFTEVFTLAPQAHDDIQQAAHGGDVISHKKMPLNPRNNDARYNLTIYPLVPGEPQGAVVRIDDITEQTNLEVMMVQTEKMLSVGGLAAGMAHEINNPLAGILQNLQVLENRFSAEIPKNIEVAKEENLSLTSLAGYMKKRRIFEMLDAIKTSGQQAAKIIKNMLSFARTESGIPISINAQTLIEDTLNLAHSDYDAQKRYDFKHIKIQTEFDNDLPDFFCHPSMIQQVLLNLLRNGAQAMSPQSAAPIFRIRAFHDEDFIYISISDNGPGMDSNLQNRIFEPFFTTKSPGEGTGLGLSVSYFIITETHRGTLIVESSLGKGTTFTIGLPLRTRPSRIPELS